MKTLFCCRIVFFRNCLQSQKTEKSGSQNLKAAAVPAMLFFCYYNRLIKICFFRRFPYDITTACGKQYFGQLISADSSVFTFKFTYTELIFVIYNVLDQMIVFIVPGPGLKRHTLSGIAFMYIWRGIRWLLL